MSLPDQEMAQEEASSTIAPGAARDTEVARLEMELSQARRQIAELQHLLKYRATGRMAPLTLMDASEAAANTREEETGPIPAPAIKQPMLVRRKIQAQGRRAALSVAGLGLAAIALLAAFQGNSAGRQSPVSSAKATAGAAVKTQPKAPLLRVAEGPIIAPAESAPNLTTVATIQKPALTPPSDTTKSEGKKPADASPAKPHRRHKRHTDTPAKPKDTPAPADVPDMQPPDTEPGVDG